jgi:hypothetical protein
MSDRSEGTVDRADKLRQHNYWDELIALRDQQRQDAVGTLDVIKERDVPLEQNAFSSMRWYLHPNIEDVSINSLIVAVHELEPGESTGKLLFQGGSIIFFFEGEGKTVMDGEDFLWKADDMINTPLRPDGVTIQHFNTGTTVARFIEASPNHVESLGVDRGSGFELQEPATRPPRRNA